MIQLSLTEEEQASLRELVINNLADLRAEIGKTDDYGYRQMLKRQEAALTRLLNALREAEAGVRSRGG